jgi:hypothetical protein
MNTVQILAVIAAVSYAGGALLTLSLCKVAGRGSRMEERQAAERAVSERKRQR